ncbi:DUF2510 domain-containing protein [Pimelobacter sp. 30-1]|uniref:DUF2510 domain-containing protein n=1 Tax=Pimelobacter sp. 30-1 TaxID=2004991 RepID=UPI001C05222D|nr:DUF2510 domain-containing protein [Pimelobacter sp. 30-1]MBU2693524.1 hypothetical protein [Pimelobacter sp. 30-1]
MEEQAPRVVPPGWYPDPKMAGTQRYWDGEVWTDNVAPFAPLPAQALNAASTNQLVTGLVVAASVGGGILSQQSVSVMSGSGIVWTGVAICVAASFVTWVVKTIPGWARVICVLVAIGAIITGFSVEQQLDERRQEIGNILNQP